MTENIEKSAMAEKLQMRDFLKSNKIRFTTGVTFRQNGKWVPSGNIAFTEEITLFELLRIISNPKVVRDFEEPKHWQKAKHTDGYQNPAYKYNYDWYALWEPCEKDERKILDNVYRIGGILLDIDGHKTLSFKEIVELIKANFPYFFIAYTSYSHYDKSMDDLEPRMRIIIPLRRPVKPREYKLAVNCVLYMSKILNEGDSKESISSDKGIDTSMFSAEHCSYAPVTARKDCYKYFYCSTKVLFDFYNL